MFKKKIKGGKEGRNYFPKNKKIYGGNNKNLKMKCIRKKRRVIRRIFSNK
jgi:hypothetical protein